MTEALSRTAASEAVAAIGWRYLLGAISTSVAVGSLADGARVATAVASATGAGDHVRVDVRHDRVEVRVGTPELVRVTQLDVEVAHGITDAVRDLGFETGGATSGAGRSVQALELAVDTLDRTRIRPFWRAVMGYVDEPGDDNGLVDPAGQGPAIWFQQLDEPRPQRNRIHFDLTVPHDEAEARIASALAAGGELVSNDEARAFWILADADGNEVCVCTWQDRDPVQ